MSHRRSFKDMSIEELALKRAKDQQELDALDRGVRKSYKKAGLDDALFALRHKTPGLKKKKKRYLDDQLKQTNLEIKNREFNGQKINDEVIMRILNAPSNPATLDTLRSKRNEYREQRIRNYQKKGENLYPSEKVRAAKAWAKNHTKGTIGRFVRGNLWWLISGAALLSTGISAPKWFKAANAYEGVKTEYLASSELGPVAHPVKREMAEILEEAHSHLHYRKEITITTEDEDGNKSEFTIPGKDSNPQAGRRDILAADKLMTGRLRETVISGLDMPNSDQREIYHYRDAAHRKFDQASSSLTGSYDIEQSYPYEQGLIREGNDIAQKAVDVLEAHMDPNVVEKENKAYSSMRFWKDMTWGSGIVCLLFGANAARRTIRNGQRRRHYG